MEDETARNGFLAAVLHLDSEMLAEKDPSISSDFQQLQVISQDRDKRLEYEAREKSILDHNQFMFEAEQRGIQIATEQINKLFALLVQYGRYEDIKRCSADYDF